MLYTTILKGSTPNLIDTGAVIFRGLGLWCLMPFSTVFQLYRGGQLNTKHHPSSQGLGASENPPPKKLYNITRGRTHLLPFF